MAIEALTYIGLRITEQCNAGPACIDRCFSQQGDPQGEATTADFFTIIQTLRENGIHAINIMGGEPTLREDLPEILKYAKSVGLEVILSTNTLSLPNEKLDAIAPYIDWLSISIDADNKRMNDGLRGPGQFASVNRVLEHIAQSDYPFRVKVNTQVTAINKNQIAHIPDMFRGQVEVWKLLQWTPRADAKGVMDIYAIEAEEYATIVASLHSEHPSVTIVERPYPEPDPDTVIIRPDGTVEVNDDAFDYTVVGNIFHEPFAVLQQAAIIYARLPSENTSEFQHSYPEKEAHE